MLEFLSDNPFWVVLVIFLARVADVTIGTMRTIVIFKGHRLLAAVLGFFEILIWLTAAGQVFRNLDTWYLAVAYAAGFAVGNIAGSWVEAKLAMGLELVRILGHDSGKDLARRLRALGYDVTALAGVGNLNEPVEILMITERRRRVPELLRLVGAIDPTAVCTVNDIKQPSKGMTSRPRRAFFALPDGLKVSKRK